MKQDVFDWKQLHRTVGEFLDNPLGSKAIFSILHLMIEQQSEELELLNKIAADVQAIRQGPLNTANYWLKEALTHAEEEDAYCRDLSKAQDAFFKALGNETQPFGRSMVMSKIAECYALLRRPADSKRWFEDSYRMAREAWHLGITDSTSRVQKYESRKKLSPALFPAALLAAIFIPPASIAVAVGGALMGAGVGGLLYNGAKKEKSAEEGRELLVEVRRFGESLLEVKRAAPELRIEMNELW